MSEAGEAMKFTCTRCKQELVLSEERVAELKQAVGESGVLTASLTHAEGACPDVEQTEPKHTYVVKVFLDVDDQTESMFEVSAKGDVLEEVLDQLNAGLGDRWAKLVNAHKIIDANVEERETDAPVVQA